MLSSSHRFSMVGKWLNGPWVAHPWRAHLGFIPADDQQQTVHLPSTEKPLITAQDTEDKEHLLGFYYPNIPFLCIHRAAIRRVEHF